jgi:hypothetical protein
MIRILCKMLHKKSAINAIHINCAVSTGLFRCVNHSKDDGPLTNPLLKLKISPAVNGFLYFLIGTYTSAPAVNLG